MTSFITVDIVPVVVPEPGDDGVVVLPHGEAVLGVRLDAVAAAVRLPVRPVAPLHRGVHVRPEPGARLVRVVPALGRGKIYCNFRKNIYSLSYVAVCGWMLTLVVAPSQKEAYSPTSVVSRSLAFSQ